MKNQAGEDEVGVSGEGNGVCGKGSWLDTDTKKPAGDLTGRNKVEGEIWMEIWIAFATSGFSLPPFLDLQILSKPYR